MREVRAKRHFEKPSEKKRRKSARARSRLYKAARMAAYAAP